MGPAADAWSAPDCFGPVDRVLPLEPHFGREKSLSTRKNEIRVGNVR